MSIVFHGNPERDHDEGLFEFSWLKLDPQDRSLITSIEYAIELRMQNHPPIMFMDLDGDDIVISFGIQMTYGDNVGPLWKFRLDKPCFIDDADAEKFQRFIAALHRTADQLEQG